MKQALKAWPEIIFLDTTYKLLRRSLIVSMLCEQESSCFTHVAGVGILVNKEAMTLRTFFELSKNSNDSVYNNIKSFMTDKALTKKSALEELFPHAALDICEFTSLKFGRTITTSKFNITSEQRDTVLNFLDKLTKSNSVPYYDDVNLKFCEEVLKSVLTYFNQNWHENRHQWTRYSMKNNMDKYTNNIVETTHAQVKKELPNYSKLPVFF